VVSERVASPGDGPFRRALEGLTGRRWQTTAHEWILVAGVAGSFAERTSRPAQKAFATRRRIVLREAMRKLK